MSTYKEWHNELEELLENHDWYYLYSDDNRVYQKGQSERDRIDELVKKLGAAGEHLLDYALNNNKEIRSWGGAMLWAAKKDHSVKT